MDTDTLFMSILAFALIFGVVFIIYIIGRLLAPKTPKNAERDSAYACGEKVAFRQIPLSISSYKYLVFFIIIDSSVLMVAFAAFSYQYIYEYWYLFLLYLGVLLIAVVLLMSGGKDQ